ncbi:MAG: fasciclin domain-containing protein [Desulfosarcinaceae bacterium]|nr:fasciclin domain-containing protein [Desulfosarcinaceae bacterium]
MKLFPHKPLLLLLTVALSLFLIGCGDSDDDDDNNRAGGGPTEDIVETAVADGRFTTLVAALQAADLDDDLQGDGPFTVLAPTDDAFAALPPGTVDALLEPAAKDELVEILSYHVIAGDDLTAADVIALAGNAIEALNGGLLNISVDNGSVIINVGGNRPATVIITDIVTSNGIIHVIDAVLDPNDGLRDIVDTAVTDGRFTTLVTALQAAGLDDDLRGTGPFTVFAPTDDAFAALPAGTVDTLLDPANQALLSDILLYHVVSGAFFATDVIALDGGEVTALNGDDIDIDIENGNVILNDDGNREAMVIITDIEATNGVIHVIDAVLDPADDV